MHPFHDYLCQQLDDLLKKRGVVVFYDPRREFEPFFDRELQTVASGYAGLVQALVQGRPIFLARFDGSFFALRAAVEPIVARDQPEPLIIYLPGASRDRHGSVLMELEKGGTCYEPQLKRLALNVLRKHFTDGQIDALLQPASIGYDDIVAFLRQGEAGPAASVLRTLFEGAPSEALLARWLADDDQDTVIAEKDAAAELFQLIETRLGLPLPATMALATARDKTLRYVLVSEFRSDLSCDPPLSVGMVPEPPGRDHLSRIRDVAERLRQDYASRYVDLASQVEAELGLDQASIDAACLGRIDTFRFEERSLLACAGELTAKRQYVEALAIVAGRHRSFWVDREVARQAQWEACRLMAELGREIDRVRPALGRRLQDPARWVQAYVAENGWYQVDARQRRLETWIAKMDEEPATEQALAVVRREYEELLKPMADGFAKALAGAGWTVPGVLPQTRIYPDVAQALGGHVACFFVDALRFEMGAELARQLEGVHNLTVRPAIAALPTITEVGMAALLPGAAASFSVIERQGKLAACIEGAALPGLNERLRFLKAKVPDAVEITLGKLLHAPLSKLTRTVGGASLVVVRTQEIDFVGEKMDSDFLARQVMATVIGNLVRAVKKLAAAGLENFVITADHGHQFSIRKDDDMKTDNPGGDTIAIHRRCWSGRGGATPPGTVRVTGAELGYATDLDFVFPTGLGVFKTGGGLSFHHGGVSLQELIIPVISFRMTAQPPSVAPGLRAVLDGYPRTITNRTFGLKLRLEGDLLTAGPVKVSVLLVAGGEQVGRAGMAVGGEFDRSQGTLTLAVGGEVSLGMMLTKDDCAALRIVAQDAATDAVLAESPELPVKLGI